MLSQYTISKKIDIKRMPIPDPRFITDHPSQITEGDMHANGLKLWWILAFHQIIKIKEKIDYQTFALIYFTPIHTWTKKTIESLREIINQAEVPQNAKGLIRFIGDTLGDRGLLDLIILLIYQKLHRALHRANFYFICLLGNHELEFITCYEKNLPFNTQFQPGLDDCYRESRNNLQKLIDKKLITREEVIGLIEECYLPHLKLIDYSVAEDGSVTYYGHAPFGDNTIEDLALELNIELTIDSHFKSIVELCDEISIRFEEIKKKKEIHLYATPGTVMYELLWNRERKYLLRNDENRYANGHHQKPKYKQPINTYELDNELAKIQTPQASEGIYTAIYCHETPHKNNSHFSAQLQTIETNEKFINNIDSLQALLINEDLDEALLSLEHTHSQFRIDALNYLFIKNAENFVPLFYQEYNIKEVDRDLVNQFYNILNKEKAYIIIDVLYLIMQNNQNQCSKKLLSALINQSADPIFLENLFNQINTQTALGIPLNEKDIFEYITMGKDLLALLEEVAHKNCYGLIGFENLEKIYEIETKEELMHYIIEYNVRENILFTYMPFVEAETIDKINETILKRFNTYPDLAKSLNAAMYLNPEISNTLASYLVNNRLNHLFFSLFLCRFLGAKQITMFDSFLKEYLKKFKALNLDQIEDFQQGCSLLIFSIEKTDSFIIDFTNTNNDTKKLFDYLITLANHELLHNLFKSINSIHHQNKKVFQPKDLLSLFDSICEFRKKLKNIDEYEKETMQDFLTSNPFQLFLESTLMKGNFMVNNLIKSLERAHCRFSGKALIFNYLEHNLLGGARDKIDNLSSMTPPNEKKNTP